MIFILATTEVQKVPATILSRCQRYDFQRITADKIAGRLEYVAGQENIELDHNAAELIGRLADGAMRDALSILDTCAGVSNTVDEALVRRMAGVTDRKYLFEISDAIAARDAVKALQEIAALRQQSVDMRRLCMELAGHYRNLMLSALPGGTDLLTGTSPEEEAAYAARKDFPQAEAVRAVNAFGAALEKMARDKMSVRQADRLVDQMLAAPNGPSPCRRTIPMVRDVRFFVNTLQHAVDLMTQKGIAATTRCDKHDGCLEYIVRIPVSSDGTAGKMENGAKEEEGEFEVKV